MHTTHHLSPAIAGVGKIRFHFTALFEGPDGDAYIPSWDINPRALSSNDTYGFVLQKVVRRWDWCPFVYVTIAQPIEVDSLTKWQGVKAIKTGEMHHHTVHADPEGKTGLEG